jgi:four helix bundle protein
MADRSFEELEAWNRSCDLAVRVYGVSDGCKDFGLKDQMTRSSVSVASNIAEGAERDSTNEFARFLRIAKGSFAELRTQIHLAYRIGLIAGKVHKELIAECMTISKMLHGLIKSVKDLKLKT